MRTTRFLRPALPVMVACLLQCAFGFRARAVELTAADILHAVREGQASRHEALLGQLRNDSDGKKFPFRLVADGPLVRYEFAGPPPTVVQVRYNEENSELQESVGGGPAERLSGTNFNRRVLGTDLTFEDLALRFVYWSRASLLEDDHATTYPANKIRLNAPSTRTEYAYVMVWVGKDSGALLRAEAYDAQDRAVKRFEVISGQKIEGKWYLKQMRIERLDPASGKVANRTYLEITGPAK